MTAINITAVNVLDNPTLFVNPFQFEIQYECLQDLQHDLEWKLTYVGSAESEKYDQELDSVLVGPVVRGQYRFIFQADPPQPAKLPPDDILGVTVLFLSCSYQGKEFIRVGYYVNNEYWEEELRETPPERPIIERLSRSILADKPRVTRFPVEFDPVEALPGAQAPAQPAQQVPMMGQSVEGFGGATQDIAGAGVPLHQQQHAPPMFDAPRELVAVDMEA